MDENVKLKSLRALHKLSQESIADKLNIGITSYILKENGKREFKQSEITKILRLFNKDYQDIFLS